MSNHDGPGDRQDWPLSNPCQQWKETEKGEGGHSQQVYPLHIFQTSSTVDLGAMTALHDTMIRKLKSCDESELTGRHVDMSAVLADIERSQAQTRGDDGKDV